MFKQWLARAALCGAAMALIGFFSTEPAYTRLAPDVALVKVSVNHPGRRKAACRDLGAEELAALAPNMRNKTSCPRERHPVRLVLEVDGKRLYERTAPPSGLFRDGWSQFYSQVVVPAGAHRILVGLNDGGTEGLDYQGVWDLTLTPADIVAIDYSADDKALILRE